MEKIKVITMCGSMRFATEMIKVASQLEKQNGWCVIQCVYDVYSSSTTKQEMDNIVNSHWKKIDISDAIYVLNIDGYIGSSTKEEIDYAIKHNKEVIYHEKA